ncbi:MAG: vWA domain-containing protein [Byssovorax sp.]
MRALLSPLSRRLALAASVVISTSAAFAACGTTGNPPGLTSSATASASGTGGEGGGTFLGTGGGNTPPPPDAGGLCGQLITQVHKDPPNVYFVLDTSGSMATPVGNSTRFALVHAAAVDLVANLGAQLNVGAALFPLDATQDNACQAGGEVLPVTPGEMLDINAFSKVTNASPFGGTPTAATLEALYPTLTKLPGRTIVVLATDGGPNCDADAQCGAEDCMDNIESACNQGVCCTPTGPSCCGPDTMNGALDCIDRKASIAAVAKLAAAGIRVYVVGVPGSETYGTVLDQMALVSGAPQIAPPFYYKVEDYSSLSGTLAGIAAIEVSCDFDLVTPPPDPSLVNVYLDDDVILQDAASGWQWAVVPYMTPVHVVELRGEACKRLKSGAVKQVQIAAGCPTMATK